MTGAGLVSPAADESDEVRRSSFPIVYRPGPADLDPARHSRREKRLTRALSFMAPIAILVSWQLAAEWGWVDKTYFPAPTTVLRDWVDLVKDGTYLHHAWASSRRIGYGFLAGSAGGLAIGLLIGRSKLLRAALEPTIVALYTIPKLSILPLLLLIFGIGESPKIMLIGISVFFVVLINTTGALESVATGHLEAARSFGLGRMGTIRHVVLPSALPQIFVGLRLAAGIAVLVVVGAEFVAANEGLGFLVWNSWSIGIASRMYVGIISIAVLGVLVNSVLRFLQRLAVPWDA